MDLRKEIEEIVRELAKNSANHKKDTNKWQKFFVDQILNLITQREERIIGADEVVEKYPNAGWLKNVARNQLRAEQRKRVL